MPSISCSGRMTRQFLRAVAPGVILCLLATGCGTDGSSSPDEENDASPVSSVYAQEAMEAGADDISPVMSIDPASITAADLDQSLVAFVECVRPTLDGTIRVNIDRYLGYSADAGLPDGRDDAEAIDREWERCDQKSSFSELEFAYRRSHPLSVEQIRDIAADFQLCANNAGLDPSTFPDIDTLDDQDDLQLWRQGFDTQVSGAAGQELLECGETAFYGPPIEF